ncbi:hypothetical protein CK203_059757 [Vitis vinifera]|uniref:Retrovirus-related Pol polyprotein from transposon TNT 1-94 n=1 Tax=Vitis vinifera TaxID=29760 RepID=A0A438FSJ5_VITVI|nr:hypothetical protein CK203_059757 [Vitis vinifera]
MKDCSPSIALIVKGDRFSLNQCPINDLEKKEMKNIPYASAGKLNICSGWKLQKHINIKYLAIREHVKSSKVAIEHISIGLLIADPLTKELPPKAYKEHVGHMGLSSLF